MRTTDIEMILETYNEAEDKEKAIDGLAKMLKVPRSEVIEKIEKWGKKRIKTKEASEKPPENKEEKNPLVPRAMGEHVQDVLFKEIDYLEKRIGELEKELEKTKADYQETYEFVFGYTPNLLAGNLSHESHCNKIPPQGGRKEGSYA